MSIAFCIPTTSRGLDIKDITESPLYKVVLKSLPETEITFYVGYDDDDPIFTIQEQRDKLKDYNIAGLAQRLISIGMRNLPLDKESIEYIDLD